MFIELAPLLLALPTLFASLNLTITTSEPLSTCVIPNMYQAMLFASLTLVFVLLATKYITVQEKYISDPLDDPEIDENLSQHGIINSFIYLWIPLILLYLSNSYLGTLRLISLLLISQFITATNIPSHRSFQMENNYNLSDNSYFILFYKKFQLYIIFIGSFIFDLCYELYSPPNENPNKTKIVLGYIFFTIPYFSSIWNKSSNSKLFNHKQISSINKIYLSIISVLLILMSYSYHDIFNFKMLLVSIGSLVILICSQIENLKLNNLNIQNLLKSINNTNILTQHYKTNYLILNTIILIIIFLNESVAPNFSFIAEFKTFFSNNIIQIASNLLLVVLIQIDKSKINVNKRSNNPTSLKELKPISNATFFSLFVQLIKSEESKSIFNFLLLNITFMFIQLLYSFRSRSLSLLSDSLHMLLDCISLFLGLMASIISKNNLENPNEKYPFGISRIGTVSGFTNGSLLLGIVFGIFNESIQRFFNPVNLENTTELLIVSTLGFLVNLIGIFAFNHGHDHSHGHSHGHVHSHTSEPSIDEIKHSHKHHEAECTSTLKHNHEHGDNEKHNHHEEHDNEHKHEHQSSHDHNNEHGHSHDHAHDDEHNHDHDHTHQHQHAQEESIEDIKFNFDNLNNHDDHDDHEDAHNLEECSGSSSHEDDNMHGIFLHIMADTLGSVGVIISTLIIKLTGWNFVDPLTSIMIATLILLSSIPLLKSSSSNLLLSLNDKSENELKYLLNEVLKIPNVKSYTTPRFWPQDGPNSKLTGYLHVQYYRTENSLQIRTKIDRLFEKSSIINSFYIQLENEVDECWCRKAGVFSTF